MKLGNKQTLALVAERIKLSPKDATSSAARSLARLQIWCGGHNLCSGRDEEGDFDALEVPLIDLATWLVEGWDDRVFDASLHEVLATQFQYSVPVAARWELSAALALEPADAESLHAWASIRALEFAATDYLLPNVLFDRIDDFVRVSWSQRAETHSFVDVAFTPSHGTVLVDARDFVALCTELVRTTYEWTNSVSNEDTRVAKLADFLERDPESVGRQAAQRWVPGLKVDAVVPRQELITLGETGRGGFLAAFLRSTDQVLPASAVTRCLRLFAETTSILDRVKLSTFTADAETGIDPAEPWECGYRLARHVRRRFVDLGVCRPGAPVPIEDVIRLLGVRICSVNLGSRDVDGVCLMDEDGRALAVLNTAGRLSATSSGKRSTLAHEFCHFAFDAPRFQVIGQADLRRSPDSMLEKRANAFAAELLLPRAVLLKFAGAYSLERSRLQYLATKFGVGMQLAVHQAENAGIRLTW